MVLPWGKTQVSLQPSLCNSPISAKETHFLARWAAFLVSTLLVEHHATVNQVERTWWRQMPISSTPLVKSSSMQRWPRQAGTNYPAHETTASPVSRPPGNTDAHGVHTHYHMSTRSTVRVLSGIVKGTKYHSICLFRLKYHTALSLATVRTVLTFNPLQSWKAHILPWKLKGIVAGANGVTFAFPIDYIAARDKVFIAGFKTKQLVIVPVLICKTTNNHRIFACSFIPRPVWKQKCAKKSRLTPDIDTLIYERWFWLQFDKWMKSNLQISEKREIESYM